MSDAVFPSRGEPMLDDNVTESLKLAATFQAVGEACMELSQDKVEKVQPRAASVDFAPFSLLLNNGDYSGDFSYLKSQGFNGVVSGHAHRAIYIHGLGLGYGFNRMITQHARIIKSGSGPAVTIDNPTDFITSLMDPKTRIDYCGSATRPAVIALLLRKSSLTEQDLQNIQRNL